MPVAYGDYDAAKHPCEVDLRSGQCCECTRHRRKCSISITRGEWDQLKEEKAILERILREEEDTRLNLMASRLQLRKRLSDLWGEKAKAAERELEAIAKDEEQLERNTFPTTIIFTPSQSLSIHDLRRSPQEWAITDRMPSNYWSLPRAQVLIEEDAIFEQFESA
jgi:hypothetical protein